jgi:hypothetical protein
MRRHVWILVAVAIAAVLFFGGMEVKTRLDRGSVVGPRTKPDANGVIQEDPAALADAAGQPLGVYALARMASSEHGRDGELIKRAVMHVAQNEARRRRVDVVRLILGPDGKFGSQEYHGGGEYVSTRQDPYEDDIEIATRVASGLDSDPTDGATNFFSPRAQDALWREGRVTRDAEAQDARWRGLGLAYVPVAGVDPRLISFYKAA